MARNDGLDLVSGGGPGVWALLTAVVFGFVGIRTLPTGAGTSETSETPARVASPAAIAEKTPDGVALDYRTPYLEFWGRAPLSEHDAKRDLGELIAKDGDLVDPEFLIVTAPIHSTPGWVIVLIRPLTRCKWPLNHRAGTLTDRGFRGRRRGSSRAIAPT